MLSKAKHNQGVALIIVLMITAVMAVIMLYMTGQGQNNARLAGILKQSTDAQLSLENAQAELIYSYMTTSFSILGPRDDFQGQSVTNAFTKNLASETKELADYSVSVQDISGLVSLVPFNKSDFNLLLLNQGVSQDELLRISDRLDDWQDQDNLKHLEGAERGDYSEPYLPKNGVIQKSKELVYILGSEDLYEQIKPYITLYASEYIVRQFMPKSLYSALGILEQSAQNTSADGVNYPSGRFLIKITSNKNISITKKFILLRGQDSFSPYSITDEELIFR
ncbi:general secretion pathway protein GspK [Pseudoalteromonas sp. SWXJZ94C]|uniref:general secretion pathway protein GspK n=1 Tax=unclassified Pseudoalteromonas TaxID=194690 RepID=UPI0014093B26|nr:MULTISPECIES: type II secretion system protein GspK [unclassified Pseudoalteromonas]MBH0057967.1 general secretion pathway protein GspK [Pseudoalteromonas sp. SWXJZ94C]